VSAQGDSRGTRAYFIAVLLLFLVIPASIHGHENLRTHRTRRLRRRARVGLRECGDGDARPGKRRNGAWIVPGALVGGLYYGLGGAGHTVRPKRNATEQTAPISDFFIFALLAILLASRIIP
jgi:hypothetical protein